MFKYLHLSLTLLLGLVSAGVSAQSPQPSKDGYFRIVNANNRADGKQYVYVTGAYAAMPNATKAEATTLPGTVIHLKMVENGTNTGIYDVQTLRSQGVDVINGYLNPAIEKVEKALKDKLNEKLSSPLASIAYGIFNTSVIGQWDLKMHLKSVRTSDGRDAYYAYATVPSMQPICDFWHTYGMFAGSALNNYPNLKAALDSGNPDDVWYEIERLALAKIESSSYASTELVNIIKHYIGTTRAENRINQGQTYYLISGNLKKVDPSGMAHNPANPMGTAHNEYDGTEAKFDFVNNNTNDQYWGPELPVTKDAAMWILEEVNNTNYFGVKPSANMRGRDGKYYTTLYVDFPFKIVGDVKAYTIEGVNAQNAQGYYFAKVKKLAQQGDVVPAQTAVVLECNSTNPVDNQLLPTGDETPQTSGNRLCGTYFGAAINGLEVKDGAGNAYNVTHDNVRAFNINTADARNPIGFYKLNSAVTSVPGNKAFLVLTSTEAQAKSFVLSFDDGETTDIEIINVEKNAAEDGVYYDLQGRRVEHPTRGIYILNGKKVVIK